MPPSEVATRAIALELSNDGTPSLELGASSSNRFGALDVTRPARPRMTPPAAIPVVADPAASAAGRSGPLPAASDALPQKPPSKVTAKPAIDETTATTWRAWQPRQLRLAAVLVGVLLGLGATGFFLYRRHVQQQARIAELEEQLAAARSSFDARDPKRWERAAEAALEVLEQDPQHPAAIGLAAEALLADSIAYGLNAPAKEKQARALLGNAISAGVTGPEVARAQALAVGTGKQPDPAKLDTMSAAAPRDLALALYLGWSRAARGDARGAAAAFTTALAAESLKLPALQGRGRARIAMGDLPGAGADFEAILAVDKDNLAAQVGRAAARPAAQGQQQEAELLEILQRRDLAAGDPRAVLHAWVLAAEVARRAGRIEPARERYRKAQVLAPQDVSVLTGLADLDILEGKLDAAGELADKALAIDPGDVRAQLVSTDLAIRQKRLDDATAKLEALRNRKPGLPALEQARLSLLTGKLAEAEGHDMAAADAYVAAAKLAGDLDLTPALTAVAKLGSLAEAATEAKEPQRAAVLRARADQIIAGFAEHAKQDSQLALALGLAFLQAGVAEQSEPWLRLVVEARPNDPEVRYQLARALARLGRSDDAIAELQRASKLDEGRAEIGIELARIYEATHRDAAAGEVLAKLLAAKEPGIEVRAAAGRFLARHGDYAKAGEQGQLIGTIDAAHPAGLYLRAEGALDAGKVEEAAKMFRAAVDADRDPQYLDGQGRAAEVQAKLSGDLKYQELALRAYQAAAAAAPTMMNPLLGQGRIYVERRDASNALQALLAAAKLDPDHPEVARLIGLSYQEISERRVAIEWLLRAYRLAPSAETAWHLGQLYNELNAPKDALGALSNATRLAIELEKEKPVPWLTDALYKLGRIYLDAGNERAAKAAWEKYVAHDPKPGAQLDEVRRELATTLQRY